MHIGGTRGRWVNACSREVIMIWRLSKLYQIKQLFFKSKLCLIQTSYLTTPYQILMGQLCRKSTVMMSSTPQSHPFVASSYRPRQSYMNLTQFPLAVILAWNLCVFLCSSGRVPGWVPSPTQACLDRIAGKIQGRRTSWDVSKQTQKSNIQGSKKMCHCLTLTSWWCHLMRALVA